MGWLEEEAEKLTLTLALTSPEDQEGFFPGYSDLKSGIAVVGWFACRKVDGAWTVGFGECQCGRNGPETVHEIDQYELEGPVFLSVIKKEREVPCPQYRCTSCMDELNSEW